MSSEVVELIERPQRGLAMVAYSDSGDAMAGIRGVLTVHHAKWMPTQYVIAKLHGPMQVWQGIFEKGPDDSYMTAAMASPWPNGCCVIAGGRGYLVDLLHPSFVQVVEEGPIMDIGCVPDVGVLLFATPSTVVAYGPQGHRWTSTRVGADQVSIVGTNGDLVYVSGNFFGQEENVLCSVIDARTGLVTGDGPAAFSDQ